MSAQTRQLVGSLLVALAIVAMTIAVVTARFGPTGTAERRLEEERLELQQERREERQELREERRDRRR